MRVSVTFGLDQEDFPLYNAFLTAMKAAQHARYEVEGTRFEKDVVAWEGITPSVAVAPETAITKQVISTFTEIQKAAAALAAPAEKVVFDESDVGAATTALAQAKGVAVASSVLAEFGVSRARDIPAEKRAAYITAVKQKQQAA